MFHKKNSALVSLRDIKKEEESNFDPKPIL